MIEPQEDDLNRKVLYRAHHGPIEEGVLTGYNSSYAFVRFGNDVGPKACRFDDLEFINADS